MLANRNTSTRRVNSLQAIQTNIKGVDLTLQTQPGLFSPRQVDVGTLSMLSCVDFTTEDKVLDLGCGYGVVGILAARLIGQEKVFLLDADAAAIECAKANAQANGLPELSVTHSDGFSRFQEAGFTRILCNPPYHTDFAVARQFILKGFNRMVIGGSMWFVTKRDKWYRNKMGAVFGGVSVQEINSYYVISAEKRRESYAGKV